MNQLRNPSTIKASLKAKLLPGLSLTGLLLLSGFKLLPFFDSAQAAGSREERAEPAQTQTLAVDDGSFENAIGLRFGGKVCAVNRLTPSRYPAAIDTVSIHFQRQRGLPLNKDVTVIYGLNPVGPTASTQIDAVSFQSVPGRVRTLDQFNFYSIPPLVAASGDFVVGYCVESSPVELPVQIDQSPPANRRSFISISDGPYQLVENVDVSFAGNFGIRASLSSKHILVSGAAIASESCAPANNAVDPGENVTIDFSLRNIGTEAINELVVTLLNGGGVVAPGDPQTYGAMAANGPPVSKPFTFLADGSCGSVVTATLLLQDGSISLGTVAFSVPLGALAATPVTNNFSHSGAPTPIPDANMVEIPITINNAGLINDLNVRVRLDHAWDSDLDIHLIGPDGTTLELSTDNGGAGMNYGSGANDCTGTFTVFDDDAPDSITSGRAPFAGRFKPEGLLSVFNGRPMLGTWKLRITDDGSGAAGMLGCWELEVSSRQPSCCGLACPVISGVSPSSALAGSQVTITGANLIGVTSVRFGGNVPAQFNIVSSARITATIPAGATSGPITISKPACPDAPTSGFTVLNPLPVITVLSPTSATAGGPAFTLNVTGSGFAAGAKLQWNGADRATTVVSATQLTAAIPASDIATAGSANVTVVNPAPGGGASGPLSLAIREPNKLPQLTDLTPNPVIAGGQNFTLTINGRDFVMGSTIRWDGNDRPTTFVSATQLTAAIPSSDIATARDVKITVFTPEPGGGRSNEMILTIANALANVPAASFTGSVLAPDSIVAAFGVKLAPATKVATTTPLPTELEGTTVRVKDSAGAERQARLFFVSPAQINYLMPPETVAGAATVTVRNGEGILSIGAVQISQTMPGLFTANADGKGVAAALALRVKPGGEQIFEPVARLDAAQNRFVAEPVDLGDPNDQIFLILFGSGIRFRTSLSATTVTIGGLSQQAPFAGAVEGLAGLDQINAGPLSRSLMGRGEVDLVLTVDGKQANTVRVSFK